MKKSHEGSRPPPPSFDETPHWGLSATLLWSLPVSLLFALLQIATLYLVMQPMEGPDNGEIFGNLENDGTLLALATLITSAGCSLLVMGIIRLKKGSRLRDYLAWRGVSPRVVLRWFLLLTVLMILSDALMAGLGRPIIPEFMARSYATAEPLWLLWLALIAAAPLFEEILFRGFLMRGLQGSFLGPLGAVLVTTLLWSSLHLQYDGYGIATVFVFGLLLGSARIVTRSLPLSIAMHAFINGVATLQTALFG